MNDLSTKRWVGKIAALLQALVFERWLVGLANVLQCGWGFLLLFLRGKKKTK